MPPVPGIAVSPKHTHIDRVGSLLLTLMVLAFIASAFWLEWQGGNHAGLVTLVVYDGVGTRTIESLSLSTGARTKIGDGDGSVGGQPLAVTLSDGSSLSVSPQGLVREIVGIPDSIQILIATPVPPVGNTPFAEWQDATRIAWVNPGDQSLQVFGRDVFDTYVPLYLAPQQRVNSMAFSEDGALLYVGFLKATAASVTTDIAVIDLSQPNSLPRVVGTVPGYARIISL